MPGRADARRPIGRDGAGGVPALLRRGVSRFRALTDAPYWLPALVFLFGISEGAVRKWLLAPDDPPEFSYLAYLAKDIAFVALCFARPRFHPVPAATRFAKFLLLGLTPVLVGATMSAFADFRLAGAVLTIRSLVVLPTVSYLVADRLSPSDATRVARWVALSALPVALLGLMQFQLPPEHPLNTYVETWQDVITAQGHVRATGTFSFISGMGSMALLSVWAGLFLRAQASTRVEEWLGVAATLAGLICGFVSVSRSAIVGSAVLIGGTFLFSRRDWRLVIVLAGIVVAWQLGLEDDALVDSPTTLTSAMLERQAQSDTLFDRVAGGLEQLSSAIDHSPLGTGLGSGQVASVAVATGQRQLLVFEAESARLVLETGVLGLLGTMLIRFGIVVVLFARCWRLIPGRRRTTLFVSSLAVLLFLCGNTAFDHVASGFAWPLAALSLALCDWPSAEVAAPGTAEPKTRR